MEGALVIGTIVAKFQCSVELYGLFYPSGFGEALAWGGDIVSMLCRALWSFLRKWPNCRYSFRKGKGAGFNALSSFMVFSTCYLA